MNLFALLMICGGFMLMLLPGIQTAIMGGAVFISGFVLGSAGSLIYHLGGRK